jgi:hypothetical protein
MKVPCLDCGTSHKQTGPCKGEAMTTDQINKKFAKLAGIPVCNVNYAVGFCKTHGVLLTESNKKDHIPKDFCADPRLVLEVMMKLEDVEVFLNDLVGGYLVPLPEMVLAKLMIDKTGKLALAGIAYLEEKR